MAVVPCVWIPVINKRLRLVEYCGCVIWPLSKYTYIYAMQSIRLKIRIDGKTVFSCAMNFVSLLLYFFFRKRCLNCVLTYFMENSFERKNKLKHSKCEFEW